VFTYSTLYLDRDYMTIKILTNLSASLDRLCCFITCWGQVS